MSRRFPGAAALPFTRCPTETGVISIGYIIKHNTLPGASFPNRQTTMNAGKDDTLRLNYLVQHTTNALEFTFTSADTIYHAQSGAYTWDLTEHAVLICANWNDDTCQMWVDGKQLVVTLSGMTNVPQIDVSGSRMGSIGSENDPLLADLSEMTLWQRVPVNAADAFMWAQRNTEMVQPAAKTRRWPFRGDDIERYQASTTTTIGAGTMGWGPDHRIQARKDWRGFMTQIMSAPPAGATYLLT